MELKILVKGKVDKECRKAKKQFLRSVLQKIARDYQNTMFNSVLFIAPNSNIFNFLYNNSFHPVIEDKLEPDITVNLDSMEVIQHD